MLRYRFETGPVFEWLARLANRLGPSALALREAAGVIDQAIQLNFDAEGRPHPWKSLTTKYATVKDRSYPGAKILERTGRLRRSIRVVLDSTNPSSVALVATSPLPYAAIHNFGGRTGPFGWTYIPPRPYLLLTKNDEEDLVRVILRGLAGEP